MLQTIRDAWKVPEIRKKMIFTLWMFVVYRIGANIPVPFVDRQYITNLLSHGQNSLFGFLDLMAGGAVSNFTIFAANIYPYITASIVLQLLTIAIPSLEALSKEGETGRKKIAKYTRYLSVALALVTALGYVYGFFSKAILAQGFLENLVVVLSIVGGSCFLIWLGELITERGIGNGISLIIFAGIVSRFPADIYRSVVAVLAGKASVIFLILFILIAIGIVVFVVTLNEGERRIPVSYAKRVVGRKIYGGQSTHIPIKVLMSGVMPIIFANSIMALPQTIAMFKPNSGFANFVENWFSPGGTWLGITLYSLLTVILIVFFTFFYTAIQFNTVEYSKNLQQNGGFIPGIRPGRATSDYLNRTVNRLVFPGGLALSLLAVIPYFLTKASGMSFNFGGTSMIIVVGVILETGRVIEQQMLMRHYRGFLK